MFSDPSAERGAQGGGGEGEEETSSPHKCSNTPDQGSADFREIPPGTRAPDPRVPPPFGTPLGSGAVGSPPESL